MITDSQTLKAAYDQLKQPGLDTIEIRPDDIYPLIKLLDDSLDVKEIGQSFMQRPIYKITTGTGPTRVLMWSQMHGDEPTATAALFDFFNYLTHPDNQQWRAAWEQQITLQIIPMVNPDGANNHSRYNAQGIDLNRDAIALQSPEGRLLNQAAKEFEPHFGFNLHDQNRYYTTSDEFHTATISLLAPAFNKQKDINESRLRAMQLIGFMNEQIQEQTPGCVGRYDDEYSHRSFGDSFSAKGISTVLIESGHYKNDPSRQMARWLNFMLLVKSLEAIAIEHFLKYDQSNYEAIPMNQYHGLVDIMLKNVNVGGRFTADYAINFNIHFVKATIHDVGDMSTQSGHEVRDMSDYVLLPLRGYVIDKPLTLTEASYVELLREGYSYFIGDTGLITNTTDWPVEVLSDQLQLSIPERDHRVHMIFSKDNEPALALIHGVWIDLTT